ncbi:iron-containing alcohol dehydrogenase [Anaerostipes caccae]|uniref:iron-containing alcohol dehydrogenase n=1 Tax=Anaerostipes caccae TaxID=105841 RepID=UPI00101C6DE0|nr:iron-containing alcohol dehydrogenase [Anaerostipes caccae]
MEIATYNLAGIQLTAGEGALSGLKEEVDRLHIKKPLIVTDEGVRAAGIIETMAGHLKKGKIAYEIYDGVKTDPLDTMVKDGLSVFRESRCDGILSIGGGSSMDVGKCISVMSVHPGDILDYARSTPEHKDFQKRGCPIISVPTTSGTGSEVSQYAVITNALTHRKTTIASPYLLSDSAILEPAFAGSMPKEVTAYTGMDALAHAVEAYTFRTALDGNIPVVDAVALEAIRLIGQNLVRAYENGNDLKARAGMQWGSLLAGIALNIGSGETHAIGSMLAKYYGVCHGISVGIPLPYCMEYNMSYGYDRFFSIAEALGADTSGLSVKEGAMAAVKKVKELQKQIRFPKMTDYIRDMEEVKNFSQECADNSCCVSNRRMNTKEAIEQVFRMCMEEET